MAFAITATGAVTGVFDVSTQAYMATVTLKMPKGFEKIVNEAGQPIQATVIIPVPEEKAGNLIASQHGKSVDRSISPAISDGTTAGANDTRSTTWAWPEAEELELAIGRVATEKIFAAFVPTTKLVPGKPLVLDTLHDKKSRFILHNAIDHIYGDKLAHVSEGTTGKVWVFVPGSAVPAKIQNSYHARHGGHNKRIVTPNAAPVAHKAPTDAKKAAINRLPSKSPSAMPTTTTRPPPVPTNARQAAWHGFAIQEPVRYDEKIEASKKPKESIKEPTVTFKVRYTQRESEAPTTATNDNDGKAEPKPVCLPPHLRKKMAAATATATEDKLAAEGKAEGEAVGPDMATVATHATEPATTKPEAGGETEVVADAIVAKKPATIEDKTNGKTSGLEHATAATTHKGDIVDEEKLDGKVNGVKEVTDSAPCSADE